MMLTLSSIAKEIPHEGAMPGIGLRFIYFATDSVPGGLSTRFRKRKNLLFTPTMMKIRDLARIWDGRDPIRDFATLMR